MGRVIRSTRFWLLAAVAVAVLAGAGYAAIPGSDGVIHACFAKPGGALRVIDSAASCKSSETPLDWNQQGRPGVSAYQIVSERDTREPGGAPDEQASVGIGCPGGKTAIGGGARVVEVLDDGSDAPFNADVDVELMTSAPIADGSGWVAAAREDGNADVRWGLRAFAICAVVQ